MLDHSSETITGTNKRQRAYANRQRETGRRRVTWWLDSGIIEDIDRRATAIGGDKATALNTVLQRLLEQTKPVTATATRPKAPEPAPVLISATETAKCLAITMTELVRMRKAGIGPKARRVKDTWRYSEQDVIEWIKEGKKIADAFDMI